MEREEGELSDEEYEDVSDNSSISVLPLIVSGKSSPLSTGRAPFRELSLTSVSEESEENDYVATHRRTKCKLFPAHIKAFNKRNGYHRYSECYKDKNYVSRRTKKYSPQSFTRTETDNIRKEYSNVSSSSESDYCIPDRKILKQLRDAVRISSSKKSPNCSLRTRLKSMIKPDANDLKNSNSDDDQELETLRDQALQSKQKSENQPETADSPNITDEDLVNLRLVALHSAVLKKHQNRRKRKEEQLKSSQQDSLDNEGKDINVQNGTDILPEIPPETKTNEDSIVEDTTSKNNNDCNQAVVNTFDNDVKVDAEDEDEDILRAMVLTSICKKIADKKNQKQITSNANSLNINTLETNKQEKISQQPSLIHVNRFVINVNSDSESDEQTVIEKHKSSNNIQNNDLFDKSLSLFLKQARAKSELNDSDISKHLPRTQQIEYKHLKRKLHQLSSRMKPVTKARKTVDVLNENKRIKLMNASVKINVPKTSSAPTVIFNQPVPTTPVINPSVKNTINVSDKQFNKVSRLQMKGKYEELSPLMARVSEARKARDNAQAEVKRLINSLRIARSQLTTTHQTYTVLMQQLVKAKSNIDKRLDDQERIINKKVTNICTSTPNKLIQKDISCDLSRIDQTVTLEQEIHVNVCPINEELNEKCESKAEVATVCLEEELPYVPVISKETDNLKYSSPLDHIQLNREQSPSNPLMVLCPYDLLGVCRDADCSYRHCGTPVTD